MMSECETAHGTLQTLLQISKYMFLMIHRCIDFTKASHGMKLVPFLECFDITQCITSLLQNSQHMESYCKIELEPYPKGFIPHVITDRQWFFENLLCLVSNAIKFCKKGSSAIVRVSIEDMNHPKNIYPVRMDSSEYDMANIYNNLEEFHLVPEYDKIALSQQEGEGEGEGCGQGKEEAKRKGEGDGAGREDDEMQGHQDHHIHLRIEVEDTGIGVSEDLKKVLFDANLSQVSFSSLFQIWCVVCSVSLTLCLFLCWFRCSACREERDWVCIPWQGVWRR